MRPLALRIPRAATATVAPSAILAGSNPRPISHPHSFTATFAPSNPHSHAPHSLGDSRSYWKLTLFALLETCALLALSAPLWTLCSLAIRCSLSNELTLGTHLTVVTHSATCLIACSHSQAYRLSLRSCSFDRTSSNCMLIPPSAAHCSW